VAQGPDDEVPARGSYPLPQVDHVLFVIREAVRIELLPYRRVLGFLLLVSVQHPFQGAAVAEFVGPGFGGDALDLRDADVVVVYGRGGHEAKMSEIVSIS